MSKAGYDCVQCHSLLVKLHNNTCFILETLRQNNDRQEFLWLSVTDFRNVTFKSLGEKVRLCYLKKHVFSSKVLELIACRFE